jgi:uncharacterized protein YndB with AHSA1/START domain
MGRTAARAKPSLTLTRVIAAPPEKVFRAWIEPEAMKRWFAPSDAFTVPEVETDPRVGGAYRIVMLAPDGERHCVRGVYREMTPPRRLVFTWAWESTPERESLVTVELKAQAGKTQLMLKHEQFADAEARDKHEQGWVGCLDRLARALAS